MSDVWFELLVAIVTAVLSIVVVPWLRTLIQEHKLENYVLWAEMAVKSAEQIFSKEEWAEKKAYCLDFLSDLVGGALSPAQLDILIESAVKELRLTEQAVES